MESVRTEILIVGSGGNGIATAALLAESGHEDLLIITKHLDFGGAWLENSYPGCEVDNPSAVYQFEFAPNFRWSAVYATQPELLAYLQSVAKQRGLYERARFGEELLEASWSDQEGAWVVRTSAGIIHARALVLATGFLEEAVSPDLAGAETFGGRVFHSSQWPQGYTGSGDRVAVVGSGSSAIQIVPELQETAEHVFQFIRTPTWVLPKNNRQLTHDELMHLGGSASEQRRRHAEAMQDEEENWSAVFLGLDDQKAAEYERVSRDYLDQAVRDPDLRQFLTPSHPIGCKRPLISDNYYSSLNAENVSVIPEAVVALETDAVVAGDGRRFEVDAIVLATGFYFGGHILHRIRRRDGNSVGEHQAGHPRAYKSISVAGCPNLFLVGGSAPNGQIWNGIFPGQAAASYIVGALGHLAANGLRAIEVREAEEQEWKRTADALLDRAPTVSGGCVNYSQDAAGHNKAAWPGSLESMRELMSEFDPDAYDPIP